MSDCVFFHSSKIELLTYGKMDQLKFLSPEQIRALSPECFRELLSKVDVEYENDLIKMKDLFKYSFNDDETYTSCRNRAPVAKLFEKYIYKKFYALHGYDPARWDIMTRVSFTLYDETEFQIKYPGIGILLDKDIYQATNNATPTTKIDIANPGNITYIHTRVIILYDALCKLGLINKNANQ
jgi:hypothetical protein